jgi:hypothetical protein
LVLWATPRKNHYKHLKGERMEFEPDPQVEMSPAKFSLFLELLIVALWFDRNLKLLLSVVRFKIP